MLLEKKRKGFRRERERETKKKKTQIIQRPLKRNTIRKGIINAGVAHKRKSHPSLFSKMFITVQVTSYISQKINKYVHC